MPPPRVRFFTEAAEELLAAQDWYADRSLDAAVRFTLAMEHAIEQIVSAPDRWRKYLFGTRRYPLRDFPYVIVYRGADEVVWVVAVAHCARRPGYWKRRKPMGS